MECIKTIDVKKSYVQGASTVEALKDVDLTVEKGEFVALVGTSGSGKTTLLNILAGLDSPSGGKIYVEGRDTTELSAAELSEIRLRRIGLIFQEYNLIPVLTALENVEYVLLLQGIAESERKRMSRAILEEVGIGELAHRRPKELSGGQQQRVAVARAIVSRPAIVLADEPTANLDSATGGSLLDLMKELNKVEEITFIVSTHDPSVMEKASRVLRIKDGRLSA